MSFAEYETSLQNGQPVRLYLFQRGPMKWGFTTADRNINHQTINFKSIEGGITDDGIRQTGDAQADTLNITVPAQTDIAQMYRVNAPGQSISVTVFDLHYGDNGFLVVWMGVVAGVKFKSTVTAEIQCQTLNITLERTGLRKTWSRTCAHSLYDNACRAQRSDYRVDSIIDRKDGVSIGVAAAQGQADGYYSGGYVEWTGPYGLEQRGIELHVKDLLYIYEGASELEPGQSVAIYPGCDRTMDTCQSKFSNILNYGGCPHMPGKSPFDGQPVF